MALAKETSFHGKGDKPLCWPRSPPVLRYGRPYVAWRRRGCPRLRGHRGWGARGRTSRAVQALPKLPRENFRIVTDEELVRIFACRQMTGRSDGAVRNRALVAFFLDTGVRLSEPAGLALDDLYLDDGLARVRGKGSKVRHVPFTEGTAAYLREWLGLRDPKMATLFGLTAHGVKMLMRRLARESRLEVHCHKFRHTSAAMMVQSGLDLHSVRRILGHSHLSVTERYLSLAKQDLRDKHAQAQRMTRLQARLDAPPERPRRRRYPVG